MSTVNLDKSTASFSMLLDLTSVFTGFKSGLVDFLAANFFPIS